MKGRKMSFQRIFLPVIFLPGFQSDRSEAFFNLIVQVEKFGDASHPPSLIATAKKPQKNLGWTLGSTEAFEKVRITIEDMC